MTKNVDAIRRLFGIDPGYDRTGNLPSMPGPGIFPDYPAAIVRNGAEGRKVELARWGMPSSQEALMNATRRRGERLQPKGQTVDFKELTSGPEARLRASFRSRAFQQMRLTSSTPMPYQP